MKDEKGSILASRLDRSSRRPAAHRLDGLVAHGVVVSHSRVPPGRCRLAL